MNKNLFPKLLLLVVVLVYVSCKKEANNLQNIATPVYQIDTPGPADQYELVNASLKLDGTTTGKIIPNDFLGFSFEKGILTDTTYLNASNTTFVNMFKNLGNGLIRIGGSSVDRTFWSSGKRTSGVTDSVYTNDVSRYKAFAQTVGWKTIWGLNLGTANPANDAVEAQYVTANMGSQIASFAIGNEPEYLYESGLRPQSYGSNQYLDEFTHFQTTIKTGLPNAVFSGPENEDTGWGLSFMQGVAGQINMLTIHYYRMGPAGSSNVTMGYLMSFDPVLQNLVSDATNEAQALQVPYRISECNSVYGGGQPGISNVYAASLWGSEFLFYLAQQGAAGINFHTQGTPDCIYSAISTVNGKSVARPLYYSMLLFHQANIRQFTNCELNNPSGLYIDAYSFITWDNKKGILIINKGVSSGVSMTINSSDPIQTATVYQLSGPELTSLTGTNINGSVVNADGTFAVNGQELNLAKKYSAVVANVKPISAMLLILN